MSLLGGQRLVAVDTETTGMIPGDGHELLEVATVVVEDAALADGWSSLLKPARAIPLDASAVHGITDAMVASAPPAGAVAAELRRRCGSGTLVFHNVSFDLPFLAGLFRVAGEPALDNPVVDTLGLARGLGEPGSNSLANLAARLGLPAEAFHRALGDARTTARLLVTLAARWESERGVRSIDELAAVSQDMIRMGQAR